MVNCHQHTYEEFRVIMTVPVILYLNKSRAIAKEKLFNIAHKCYYAYNNIASIL